MFVKADLSKRQYEIIRSTNKKLYPYYSWLQKTKMDCYPDKELYKITATSAEIKLQNLLNHTIIRLMLHLEEVI